MLELFLLGVATGGLVGFFAGLLLGLWKNPEVKEAREKARVEEMSK